MILVDDVLALRMLTNGAMTVAADDVATTCAWWWRLSSALQRGAPGRRAGRQSASVRASLRRTVGDLAERFVVLDRRELIVGMGLVAGQYGLNLLGAEALVAAEALGADIVVGQDTPELGAAARDRGVGYLVEG